MGNQVLIRMLCLGMILFFLGCNANKKVNEGSSGNQVPSAESYLQQHFPSKPLPLVLDPRDEKSTSGPILQGSDLSPYFEEWFDAESAVQAVARINLFPNSQTVIFREDLMEMTLFISTSPIGRFSVSERVALPIGIGFDYRDIGTISQDGHLEVVQHKADGSTSVPVHYQVTAENKMLKLD